MSAKVLLCWLLARHLIQVMISGYHTQLLFHDSIQGSERSWLSHDPQRRTHMKMNPFFICCYTPLSVFGHISL